jgi:hypothetical protein
MEVHNDERGSQPCRLENPNALNRTTRMNERHPNLLGSSIGRRFTTKREGGMEEEEEEEEEEEMTRGGGRYDTRRAWPSRTQRQTSDEPNPTTASGGQRWRLQQPRDNESQTTAGWGR